MWESNSRAKSLVSEGKIEMDKVVPKSSPLNFPAETATVRMSNLTKKNPTLTIYIKDTTQIGSYVNHLGQNQSYEFGPVLRVTLNGRLRGSASHLSFNGNSASIQPKDICYIIDYVREKIGYA